MTTPITVCVELYRREQKRWVRYCYNVEVEELTPQAIAEAVADRMAEEYARRFRPSRGVLRAYRVKMRDVLEEAISVYSSRELARLIQQEEGKDKLITVKLVNALVSAKVFSVDQLKGRRIGINTNHYIFLDSDCKAKQCLLSLIMVAETIYQMIAPKARRKYVIAETQRGLHLYHGLRLNEGNWRRVLKFFLSEQPFPFIDYNHIYWALRRGYVTLSLGRRRSYMKRDGEMVFATKPFYERYKSILEEYASEYGLEIGVMWGEG